MIATLDVGNTAVKLGWFQGLQLIHAESREGLAPSGGVDWIREELAVRPAEGLTIACVVPRWRSELERLSSAFLVGFVGEASVRSRTQLADGVQGLGADRWMAAEGASASGRPALAVTLGTATTFTVVDARGRISGGAIAPGLGTGAAALARAGAQLFEVKLEGPGRWVGATTTAALQSGTVLGHAALVSGMVERIEVEVGGPLAVVLTGGWSALLAPLLPARYERDPHLVLRGLAQAAAWTWGSAASPE